MECKMNEWRNELHTPFPPSTYINPIGWHHAAEAYHLPHSALYKPRTRISGFLFGFLTVKGGTDVVPKRRVRNYHYSLRNKPAGRSSQSFICFYVLIRRLHIKCCDQRTKIELLTEMRILGVPSICVFIIFIYSYLGGFATEMRAHFRFGLVRVSSS